MRIHHCSINHLTNPIGYQLAHPVFSYLVDGAEGKKQESAQIRIYADEERSGILADTGRSTEISQIGTMIPVELAPRTRYYWDVEVWSDRDEHAVSELQYFETGKLDEEWQGSWITAPCAEAADGTERQPIFHKGFALAQPVDQVQTARLYISGLGLYEAYLGGERIGEEIFTPYSNNYKSWVQYQTFDVKELLDEENALSVELANGWYKGRFTYLSKAGQKGCYGDQFLLIAELHVTYADGTEQVIATDDSWTVTRSKIYFSNFYEGEYRDDTLPELPAEQAILLSGEEAAKLNLTERLSVPVLKQEILPAIELIDTPAGEKVFDIGQNIAGIFRLKVNVPAGTRIHIQTGEVLQEGNFYRDNLRTALSEYVYVSDGTPIFLEPRFTYYGYRYVKVDGIENLRKEDLVGIALYSDNEPAGTLTTGDEMFNKLISNVMWGQKGNFIDVPTDCPQRDERMGWTADTQVFVPTATYFSDNFAFYKKYLYDMRTEQELYDGMIPNTVPSFGIKGTSSVWGDAATIIPWALYRYYGDVTILDDALPMMSDWVDYIERLDGDDHNWRNVFHYGDWLALDNPKGGIDQVMGGTEEGYIADVYYYNSAMITAQSAKILGYDELAEHYENLAARIKRDIKDEFFTATERCAITTQTGYILALYYDLVDNRKKSLDSLLKALQDKKNKIQTGFVGTALVSRVLSACGQDALAYEILHDEEYPGWLYEIRLGGTTMWERWNSMSPDGSVSSTGMNSFNHYAYGSIAEWMWQTIGGINADPAHPGFTHAILRPVADPATGCASAEYRSAAGTYRVAWKMLSERQVSLSIDVPFNCTATLLLPYAETDQCSELEAGHYEMTYVLRSSSGKLSAHSTMREIRANEHAWNWMTETFPQIINLPPSMMDLTLLELLKKLGKDDSSIFLMRFETMIETK